MLVDRTAERNIMTDQTSECDSVSSTLMLMIHNCTVVTCKDGILFKYMCIVVEQ